MKKLEPENKIFVEKLDAAFYDFRKKSEIIAWLTDKNSAEKIFPAKNNSAETKNVAEVAHSQHTAAIK